MGQCAPQTFPHFTSECIQALLEKVSSHGVAAAPAADSQTSGTASRAGFSIRWQYEPESQTLTVQCTASPFYAPCSLINTQINSWISGCYPVGSGSADRV